MQALSDDTSKDVRKRVLSESTQALSDVHGHLKYESTQALSAELMQALSDESMTTSTH